MKAIYKAHGVDFWEWDMTWSKEEALQSLKDFFKSIDHNVMIFSSDEYQYDLYIKSSEYQWNTFISYGEILVIDEDNYRRYHYYHRNKFKESFGVIE